MFGFRCPEDLGRGIDLFYNAFVEKGDTTLHHIGELMIPLAAGIIAEKDVKGDFYDLIARGASARKSGDEITVFKNGGGAHLDLMIADYISGAVAGKS